MSSTTPQSVPSGCRKYVKSRIKFNTFNTFSNVGYGVQVVNCKDLGEADAKAKEVLEAFFDEKVNIKEI